MISEGLRSQRIKILEVEETTQIAKPLPAAVDTKEVPTAEKEQIPLNTYTPDGTEIRGVQGKLLAFLAYQGTFKDRADSAFHIYGKDDASSMNNLNSLINYIKSDKSVAFKHNVRIETQSPSEQERRLGIKSKDRAVFITEPADQKGVETTPGLQAAVLADELLRMFEGQPKTLQQLGLDLSSADINELDKIRQSAGTIDPQDLARLRDDVRSLVKRYLADIEEVYDEFASNPQAKNLLLILTHFTRLVNRGQGAVDQLFGS